MKDEPWIHAQNYGRTVRRIGATSLETETKAFSEIGFFQPGWEAWDVWVSGSLAYAASRTDGLRILDVSDPRAPSTVETLDTPGDA